MLTYKVLQTVYAAGNNNCAGGNNACGERA